MPKFFIFVALAAAVIVGAFLMRPTDEPANIKSIAIILPVERIEPSIPFWEKAGFIQADSVPEGDHLGFLMMSSGDAVIMFQTIESLVADDEVFKQNTVGAPSLLYVTVGDITAIQKALEGFDQVMAYRETFYGSKEVGYKSPGGHIVTFAEFAEDE